MSADEAIAKVSTNMVWLCFARAFLVKYSAGGKKSVYYLSYNVEYCEILKKIISYLKFK